jgi:glycosyl transferase, family 25
MERQLAALGLTAEVVEAVEARALGPEPTSASPERGDSGPSLTAAERACRLSHLAVYRRIIDEDLGPACILEDDCAMAPDFPAVLGALERRARGWDVVLLGHHSSRFPPADGAATCYVGARLHRRYRLARVAEFPMGAYAYVVRRHAAERLLAFAAGRTMPADWLTGYSPRAGLRLHALRPPCIVPDATVAVPTTIGSRGGLPPARPGRAPRLRRPAGVLLLFLRQIGIRPYSYARRI